MLRDFVERKEKAVSHQATKGTKFHKEEKALRAPSSASSLSVERKRKAVSHQATKGTKIHNEEKSSTCSFECFVSSGGGKVKRKAVSNQATKATKISQRRKKPFLLLRVLL